MSRRRQAQAAASSGSGSGDSSGVIRIRPLEYIHVQDNNANVTRVVIGPATYTTQQHERVTQQPSQMILVPPRHYCIVENPVVRDGSGEPLTNAHGQARVRLGDREVRLTRPHFALYPGEKLIGTVRPLQVVPALKALRLLCVRDHTDKDGTPRKAGDEYMFVGPQTYIPAVEEKVVEPVSASIIEPNHALKLRARKACVDASGTPRKAGEEWLVRTPGAYMPGVDEVVEGVAKPYILTPNRALHLKAIRGFKDQSGRTHKAGEEWLVTRDQAPTYVPDVYEEVVNANVRATTLTQRQYVVIRDPVDASGKPQLGQLQLKRGPATFFLLPGESLEGGVKKDVHVLREAEALLLKATDVVRDDVGDHKPGDYWMVHGPRDYVPPVGVEIVERRQAVPLDESEGIYVRDWATGKVRVVSNCSYMLKPSEELWHKDISAETAALLAASAVKNAPPRKPYDVVTYRARHNTAVQIYDYKEKKSRIEFGPQLIMLGPDEQITVWSLSGDLPKRPGVVKTLALRLGPEFTTDQFTVETGDHAKLRLKLAYNWHFETDPSAPNDAKVFVVPDFVGDMCKAVASQVRGAVAATTFDHFHKYSAVIIHRAVFPDAAAAGDADADAAAAEAEAAGDHDDGVPVPRVGPGPYELRFEANGLVITNIDIQSVEPVDQRTRDSLVKSVQLAIKMTTESQEARAKHDAQKVEQDARGALERQKLQDDAAYEKLRQERIRLETLTQTVEQTGEAMADAQANAKAREIEGHTDVMRVELEAQAKKIASTAELDHIRAQHDAELQHRAAMNALELKRTDRLSKIEASKFSDMVSCIGADTIATIAKAGPELEGRMLGALGLKSVLITDGSSPVNLFSSARGLVAKGQQDAAKQ